MKVKIRLKIDEKRPGALPPYRRIIIGELKPFPSKKFLPDCIRENFFFVEGKNFYVDQPQKNSRDCPEGTQ